MTNTQLCNKNYLFLQWQVLIFASPPSLLPTVLTPRPPYWHFAFTRSSHLVGKRWSNDSRKTSAVNFSYPGTFQCTLWCVRIFFFHCGIGWLQAILLILNLKVFIRNRYLVFWFVTPGVLPSCHHSFWLEEISWYPSTPCQQEIETLTLLISFYVSSF